MAGKEENPIKIEIHTSQQGTLVVGDNNTVTTHNSQTISSGTALSPKQALKLDGDVKEVAADKSTEPEKIWTDLCQALNVPSSTFITREMYPSAEKILLSWKGKAVRDVVNENGG